MRSPADAGTRPPIPYGTWPSELTADAVASARRSVSTLRAAGAADRPTLWWSETRPLEGGRQVVVAATSAGAPADVLPEDLSVRSRVHEYGGAAYCLYGSPGDPLEGPGVEGGAGTGAAGRWVLALVHADDQRIYRLELDAGLHPVARPTPLTPAAPPGARWCHGDLWAAPDGRGVLAVRERLEPGGPPRRDLLLAGAGSEPRPLWQGADFVSAPRPGPPVEGGYWLAWTAWDHPAMSWESSRLWVGRVEWRDGVASLEGARAVAGGPTSSVGQPTWCGDDGLVFAWDRDGWWQPWSWRPRDGGLRRLSDLHADFHVPEWQLGQPSMAFLGEGRLGCRWRLDGRDHLGVLELASGRLRALDQPCLSVASLCGGPWGLAWIGSTATERQRVWVHDGDLAGGRPRALGGARRRGHARGTSVARAVLAERAGALPGPVPALWYPPTSTTATGPPGEAPPGIVHCHGGPTGSNDPGWDPLVQFFTSRGFAWVQVDYRGSSGYGRAWRDALGGRWGEVDADDCLEVARHLVESGWLHPRRVAVRGSSAGGLTALNCLVRGELFCGAASWYGVTDLLALAEATHDFEAHYLDGLVGPLPAAAAEYRRRSPVHRASDIHAAVLLLQGREDVVVPLAQADGLADELARRGQDCEYRVFDGEGHGFRRAATTAACLRAELAFYRRVMGIAAGVHPGQGSAPG